MPCVDIFSVWVWAFFRRVRPAFTLSCKKPAVEYCSRLILCLVLVLVHLCICPDCATLSMHVCIWAWWLVVVAPRTCGVCANMGRVCGDRIGGMVFATACPANCNSVSQSLVTSTPSSAALTIGSSASGDVRVIPCWITFAFWWSSSSTKWSVRSPTMSKATTLSGASKVEIEMHRMERWPQIIA